MNRGVDVVMKPTSFAALLQPDAQIASRTAPRFFRCSTSLFVCAFVRFDVAVPGSF